MWRTSLPFGFLVYGIFLKCCQSDGRQHHHGSKVFRIHPTSVGDVPGLKKLINDMNLDVWHYPRDLDDTLDVMVPRDHVTVLKKKLQNMNTKFEEMIDNVGRLIDKEQRQIRHRQKRATNSPIDFTRTYQNVSETIKYLKMVESDKSKNANAKLITLGKSYEGRDLTVIKLFKGSDNCQKPAILIDAGIHAREWIAPVTANHIIYQLAYNKESAVTTLLDQFDWYIMPLANPDGYEYSQKTIENRLWRKTRNSNLGSKCFGVDGNRNFDYHWDPSIGGSEDPCSDVFSGYESFSIPETERLGEFMKAHGNTIKLYLTLHSFGQYLLYPWGFAEKPEITDKNDLDSLARIAATAMANAKGGFKYQVGSSSGLLYTAAGGSDDYAKGGAGIKYSYTVELPIDNFLVNIKDIPVIVENTWAGVVAFAKELGNRFKIPSGGVTCGTGNTDPASTHHASISSSTSSSGSSTTFIFGGNSKACEYFKTYYLPRLPYMYRNTYFQYLCGGK